MKQRKEEIIINKITINYFFNLIFIKCTKNLIEKNKIIKPIIEPNNKYDLNGKYPKCANLYEITIPINPDAIRFLFVDLYIKNSKRDAKNENNIIEKNKKI